MEEPKVVDEGSNRNQPDKQAIGGAALLENRSTNNQDYDADPNSGHDHTLGRDDPLWPLYLEEAEKYDDIMMNKWNSSMDQLLLFATLFSAIVTAFVVESSQNLQPDNAAITASAMIEIATTLRILANGGDISQNITTPPPSLDDFQPGPDAFLVNLAWFVSLSLSITVALLASLVKQWCNSFVSDRMAPPCNQARIRQARLNALKRWRTEFIVSALPVMMHAALGLFLLGLLVFLESLNHVIFVVALIITTITAVFYFVTTVIPFFSPFCPYETPLSSLKAWGYCYQFCLALLTYIHALPADKHAKPDFTNHLSPCEEKERMTSHNTTPDELTGDALNWVIIHSQRSNTRDTAIRSISRLKSERALQQVAANPDEILPQVVQSFTSCFSASPAEKGELKIDEDINDVSLHGQALVILVNRLVVTLDANHTVDHLAKWGLDTETTEAVKLRFQWLAENIQPGHPNAGALGLIGLSAWYDFAGQRNELRFNRGDLINRLTLSLKWSLPTNLCTGILHALMVESVYWAPGIDAKRRRDILHELVELIPTAPSDELKSRLACAISVLTLGLNRGSTLLRLPPDSADIDLETGVIYRPAYSVAAYYTKKPQNIIRDGQSLLLFALTGLMEHYEHCIFDDEHQTDMKTIAQQLSTLDNLRKSQSITLPQGTMLNTDIQGYFVDVLLLYLKQTRNPSRVRTTDETFVYLLQSINEKYQVWIDHGPLIILPIVQILAHTDSIELQSQCLSTILSKWDSGSLSYTRMLFAHDVPHKLVKITRDLDHRASGVEGPQSNLPSIISVFFHKLATQFQTESGPNWDKLLARCMARCMEKILEDDLLETLVQNILKLNVSHRTDMTIEHPQEQGTSRPIPSSKFSRVALYDETVDYLQRFAEEGGKDKDRYQTPEATALLLEKLLQAEKEIRLAKHVVQKWKSYVARRNNPPNQPSEVHG